MSFRLGEVVAGRFDDPGGYLVEVELVGLNGEVGALFVERDSSLEQFSDCPSGVFVIEKRTVVVAGGSVMDFLGAGDEPDDVAHFSEELTVFLADDDAASGGNDVSGLLEKRSEKGGFHVAKGILALFFENFRNAASLLFLDQLVGIDDGIAQGLGQAAPDGGLACSHETYEDDVLRHADGEKTSFLIRFMKLYLLKIRRGHEISRRRL